MFFLTRCWTQWAAWITGKHVSDLFASSNSLPYTTRCGRIGLCFWAHSARMEVRRTFILQQREVYSFYKWMERVTLFRRTRPRYTLSAHISKSLFAGSGRFSQITSHFSNFVRPQEQGLGTFISEFAFHLEFLLLWGLSVLTINTLPYRTDSPIPGMSHVDTTRCQYLLQVWLFHRPGWQLASFPGLSP